MKTSPRSAEAVPAHVHCPQEIDNGEITFAKCAETGKDMILLRGQTAASLQAVAEKLTIEDRVLGILALGIIRHDPTP